MRALLPALLLAALACRPSETPPFAPPFGRVELTRGGSTFTLTRDSGGWRVDPPGDWADAEAGAALFDGLARTTLGPALPEGNDPAAYGLGKDDGLLLRAFAPDGRPAGALEFGRRALADGVHARRPGGPVRLARGPRPDLLQRLGPDWTERRLLPGGCPEGAEVDEGGAVRRVGPDDPLCRVVAVSFDPPAASVFGGFEKPKLTVTAFNGGSWKLGARLGVGQRGAQVRGRDVMLRVKWPD